MNAIVKHEPADRQEMITVLRNSLYPGASAASVELVLSYCRVNGIDPMLKAVHIVPMWDKATGGMKDVLMPGIADYRIKAARSGAYAGKGEPEFGPDIKAELGGKRIAYPQWCRVTIYRLVAGKPEPFTAREFWLENYATEKRGSEAPNQMWSKRPYGQLAKCAEAQALRMAFPELSGGQPTAEEMEGKDFAGVTLDAAPLNGVSLESPPEPERPDPAVYQTKPPAVPQTPLDRFRRSPLFGTMTARLAVATSMADVLAVGDLKDVHAALAEDGGAPPEIKAEIKAMLADAFARFSTVEVEEVVEIEPEPAAIAPGVEVKGEEWMAA